MSIVVSELRKVFGAQRAVDGVSFRIAAGEVVGLIGPNGSGKTTILRMLATFLFPSAGRIEIAGHDARSDPVAVRRSIGYLPEALPGYSESRVDEFLLYRAQLKAIPRRARRAEVDRCLGLCSLADVRRRLLGRLSLGYRRRAGLADALLGAPPVLLLDEPTVGLDPLQVRETRDMLLELAGSTTVVMSTHLLSEAEAVCGRVLMLFRGRLAADMPLARARSRDGFVLTIRGPRRECAAALAGVEGVEGVREAATSDECVTFTVSAAGPRVREEAVRLCVERGWGVVELRRESDDLESRFVRVALGFEREAA